MQTIYINAAPVALPPARSHKKLFWFIIIPLMILLTAVAIFLTQFYFGPPSTLQITTTRGVGSVQVDSGSLSPILYKADLTPIPHQVTVSDADHAAYPWKTSVNLVSGTLTSIDVDLGPTSDFTGAVTLSLTRGSNLIIHTTPDQAAVSLDGDNIGQAPISRHVPGPGNHTITVKKDGYLDKTFQITVTNGFSLTADTILFKNPSFTLSSIKSENITPGAAAADISIVNRSDSSLAKVAGKLDKPTSQAWTSATFINLNAPDSALPTGSLGWMEGLYYHAVVHLKLPDIPFQFFIDENGKIYEGRDGGRDSVTFDVTDSLEDAAKSPTLRPGVVYVGYLGTKGSVSSLASDAFEKLVAYLGKTATTQAPAAAQKVKIGSTPNGFLRVRASPSTTANEVSRVKPGDSFDLVSEQSGWFQIKLNDGSTGWVSSDYAQKV